MAGFRRSRHGKDVDFLHARDPLNYAGVGNSKQRGTSVRNQT